MLRIPSQPLGSRTQPPPGATVHYHRTRVERHVVITRDMSSRVGDDPLSFFRSYSFISSRTIWVKVTTGGGKRDSLMRPTHLSTQRSAANAVPANIEIRSLSPPHPPPLFSFCSSLFYSCLTTKGRSLPSSINRWQ